MKLIKISLPLLKRSNSHLTLSSFKTTRICITTGTRTGVTMLTLLRLVSSTLSTGHCDGLHYCVVGHVMFLMVIVWGLTVIFVATKIIISALLNWLCIYMCTCTYGSTWVCTQLCVCILMPLVYMCCCLQALKNMVLYVLLAPYDHEQSDLLHRIHEEKKLEKLPVYWLVLQ